MATLSFAHPEGTGVHDSMKWRHAQPITQSLLFMSVPRNTNAGFRSQLIMLEMSMHLSRVPAAWTAVYLQLLHLPDARSCRCHDRRRPNQENATLFLLGQNAVSPQIRKPHSTLGKYTSPDDIVLCESRLHESISDIYCKHSKRKIQY